MKKKVTNETIDIIKLEEGTLTFNVLGTSPLILNRMSEKAKRELLLPRKKTASERASTLKHDPPEEFHAAPYIDHHDGPTLLQALSTWFKNAMMEAALDIPDVTKAKIQRLVWVRGERIPLYGAPLMHIQIVRSSDMNRTPDVRTRAILPRWACQISISFRKPLLREQGISNLLAAAGVTPGIGDWRVGKNGSMGQFELVDADNPEFLDLITNQGRAIQEYAMDNPACDSADSEELLGWFYDEKARRGFGRPDEIIVIAKDDPAVVPVPAKTAQRKGKPSKTKRRKQVQA